MNLHEQLFTLFGLLVCGLGLGVLFDLYRVLSGQFRIPRWLIAILDLCYWLASIVLVFALLFVMNDGQVRFYVFLAVAAGLWFYFVWMSAAVIKMISAFINAVKRLFFLILKGFEWGIVRPALAIYRIFIILLGFLAAISIFLFKIVLKLFYPLGMLWNRVWEMCRRLFR